MALDVRLRSRPFIRFTVLRIVLQVQNLSRSFFFYTFSAKAAKWTGLALGPFPKTWELESIESRFLILWWRFHATGLSKRKGAKYRELSLNFPWSSDWLCISRPSCMAALGREFLNNGHFFCTTLYFTIYSQKRAKMKRLAFPMSRNRPSTQQDQ